MEIAPMSKKHGFGRKLIATGTLAAFLAFAAAPLVRASEAECRARMERADHRVHEAAEHHGWDSREAEHARGQLREAREYCWSHEHKWWDVDGRRWHSDRDWDDHDHDHGRDHDHDR
ncbi:MAG TPA: hypothetical protein VGI16_09945 [Candidatus Acidoferrum sp.]|jgi:hypothetical protein